MTPEEPRAEPREEFRDVLQRLSARGPARARYRIRGEVGRGGMGAVLRVWDEDLRRHLAMKVVLGPSSADEPAHQPTAAEVDPKSLGRFLGEAQITGQLDHPGIVPVHDMGVDGDGRVYFTMQLVQGRDLDRIYELVRTGEEGWSVTRALNVLLKVCDAMDYAHSKSVVHRDLKPANVMVGRFGEVYVMDWGLAHVLGEEEATGGEARPADGRVETERLVVAPRDGDLDEALYTVDGDVVGTPAYMSPEQAIGKVTELDPRADVYSVGAMLYHLLAGRAPYSLEGEKPSPFEVLREVHAGPPAALHGLAPDAPAELVAICDKAMARALPDRYADMGALRKDLRAFLEGRVVHAYQTGAVAELRKWVRRNRGLAAAIAGLVLAVMAGLGATGWVMSEGKKAADRERAIAEENERIARREHANVLRLSAMQELEGLQREAEDLWPAAPERSADLRAWLDRARALVEGLHPHPETDDVGHHAQLAALRERALPAPPGEDGADGGERVWTFADETDRWWHDQLASLVSEIEAFADPDEGLVGGLSERWGMGVERRLRFAEEVRERSLTGPAARAAWEEAVASIADPEGCPAYGGLRIAPQLGLLPLGRDPRSGLWEFAHLASGAPAARDEFGELVYGGECGLVLVLVPGGAFHMGAQADDPGAPNHDPAAQDQEGPVFEVELDPYFISKYEMTQGQWLRFSGANPSRYDPSRAPLGVAILPTHPVEMVSWSACAEVLERMQLELPTEAQWERASRGGTETPWWPGARRDGLVGVANLADSTAARAGANWSAIKDWPELDDGWAVHAPVGTLAKNPFGLHDVHGNVREWCREGFGAYSRGVAAGDGERPQGETANRVFRGGSYSTTASVARSAYRGRYPVDTRNTDLGLRPVRRVDPPR